MNIYQDPFNYPDSDKTPNARAFINKSRAPNAYAPEFKPSFGRVKVSSHKQNNIV